MKLLSHVRLFATPWTVAYQTPPSMGFSRQEYWSGWPFPSPGDLPDPGIEPRSPALQADALLSEPPGKSLKISKCVSKYLKTPLPAIKGLTAWLGSKDLWIFLSLSIRAPEKEQRNEVYLTIVHTLMYVCMLHAKSPQSCFDSLWPHGL